jgi:hypothetical protein
MPIDGSIGPPRALADFQVGWFWNLFWDVLGRSAGTGTMSYVRSKLWIVAGAHSRAHWDANCALVMAAFEISTCAESSEQIVVSYPPLTRLLDEARQSLRNHKKGERVFRNLHSHSQASGNLSPPLQSGFAFDLQEPIQIQKQNFTPTHARAPARETASGYSQADFDARDLRRMAKAWDWLCEKNAEGAARGCGLTARQMFEQVCDRAGISIERGLELEERRRKWPKNVPEWLREEKTGS